MEEQSQADQESRIRYDAALRNFRTAAITWAGVSLLIAGAQGQRFWSPLIWLTLPGLGLLTWGAARSIGDVMAYESHLKNLDTAEERLRAAREAAQPGLFDAGYRDTR